MKGSSCIFLLVSAWFSPGPLWLPHLCVYCLISVLFREGLCHHLNDQGNFCTGAPLCFSEPSLPASAFSSDKGVWPNGGQTQQLGLHGMAQADGWSTGFSLLNLNYPARALGACLLRDGAMRVFGLLRFLLGKVACHMSLHTIERL